NRLQKWIQKNLSSLLSKAIPAISFRLATKARLRDSFALSASLSCLEENCSIGKRSSSLISHIQSCLLFRLSYLRSTWQEEFSLRNRREIAIFCLLSLYPAQGKPEAA